MRLTQSIRDSFVRAVLADIPKEDYIGQIQKLTQDYLRKKMPKEVAALYDNKELRGEYLNYHFISVPDGSGYHRSVCVFGPKIECAEMPKSITDKIDKLAEKNAIQQDTLKKLKADVKRLIISVNTRAALVKAAPELEKYLPEETEKTKQLPVATGVVTALVDAGWPKGGKK